MVDPSLIKERINTLREATRRPLYEELVKFQQQDDKQKSLSWIQIVQHVAEIYPYMTLEQRGHVWRLLAILVLAFVLPLSTGNESTLQSPTRVSVTELDLEERLARAAHYQQVVTNGTLMDSLVLCGWQAFVQQALIQGVLTQPSEMTPCESDQAADLLHVLAMVITPRLNPLELDLPAAHRQRSAGADMHPAVARLYRLVQCPTSTYFYIQNGQRQELVQSLYQYWQTPAYQSGDSSSSGSSDPFCSLAWTCGVAHLRASLGAWARRHYTHTRHVLALQARLDTSWTRAWNTALNELVGEDRIDYHTAVCACACSVSGNSEKEGEYVCGWTQRGMVLYQATGEPRPMPPTNVCPHVQRGFALACLLLESCGRPQHAQNMATALTALGDALEWQNEAWTADDEKTVAPIVCLAAVLLSTTSLLLQLVDATATRKNFGEVYENILHCSIEFLRHSNAAIRQGAARVLEHAWNTLGLSPTPFASVMLTTLQQIDTPEQRNDEWKFMVGMLARASPAFAKQLASSSSLVDEKQMVQHHVLVAAVACNQPGTFAVATLEKALAAASAKQALSLVAALVASRQSYYFDKTQSMWGRVSRHLEEADPWDRYRLGIFSLTNGEYITAAKLFGNLSLSVSNKHYFLWIETLSTVSQAEGILAKQGALGIPAAGTLLHNALAYLDGLQNRESSAHDYSFQIRFLLLRLDILDLVTVLRQIIREMRLTGQLPAKGTRTFSHIPAIFRSFLRLAKQFAELNERYGLLWQSQRTSRCLASFRDLAFFLAQTTKAAFGPILPAALVKIHLPDLSTKLVFPMNKLIQELDSLVIRPFIKSGNSVDSKIISTALLQVIDGILMAPIPIPRDFCAPLPAMHLEWTVRPDSSHVAEMNQSSFDVVETFPSVSALVCVQGRLSNATKVRRAIRSIVLSYQIRRLGSLDEDGVTKEALRLRPIAGSTSVAIGRQGDFCVSFTLPPFA